MQSNLITLTFTFLFLLSANAFCLSTSKIYQEEISDSALQEYKLHACGRALAAIKNFQVFAKIAVSRRRLSQKESNATLNFIEGEMKQRYEGQFMITQNYCVEQQSEKKAAVLFLKNESHTRKNIPNYSYRIL